MKTRFLAAAIVLWGAALLVLAVPTASAADRGKLLFSGDFAGTALDPAWTGKVGDWSVAGGVLKGAERPEDHHAAARQHRLEFHDAIVEFSFRLDGASQVALMLNGNHSHVCFLFVGPTRMYLQIARAPDETEAPKIATLDVPTKQHKWHKAVVEVHGSQMTARLDGKTLAGNTHRIDLDKTNLGFLVYGANGSFSHLKVYALASP